MNDSLPRTNSPSRIVVLGIGNVLLSDEGVGIHAIKCLVSRCDFADGVEVVDGGTTGMELLPQLEGIDQLIVVDAVRFGRPPASIVRLEGQQVPAYFKTKLSPHQVGLSDLLAALAFKGSPPGHVVILGVQPVSLSVGLELSAEVAARLEELTDLVAAELAANVNLLRIGAEKGIARACTAETGIQPGAKALRQETASSDVTSITYQTSRYDVEFDLLSAGHAHHMEGTI